MRLSLAIGLLVEGRGGGALLSEPILTDQLVAYFGMRPLTIYGSEDKN